MSENNYNKVYPVLLNNAELRLQIQPQRPPPKEVLIRPELRSELLKPLVIPHPARPVLPSFLQQPPPPIQISHPTPSRPDPPRSTFSLTQNKKTVGVDEGRSLNSFHEEYHRQYSLDPERFHKARGPFVDFIDRNVKFVDGPLLGVERTKKVVD